MSPTSDGSGAPDPEGRPAYNLLLTAGAGIVDAQQQPLQHGLNWGMSRPDVSDFLVHFTSGDDDEGAYRRLSAILRDMALLGNGQWIRSGRKCVCFSEAPLPALEFGLVNPNRYSRYSPFGLLFTKEWIFGLGGRPVIYQTHDEFDLLPTDLQWRHMRFDLRADPPVDFTWEREWRVPKDRVEFDSKTAQIVLPNREWASRLESDHDAKQAYLVRQYSQVFDESTAEMYRKPFNWTVLTLG